MTAGDEAEVGIEVAQPLAQHGDLLRRRPQGGAGPQPDMNRKLVLAALDQHDVERDAAMDRRHAVGLQQLHRPAVGGEPGEGIPLPAFPQIDQAAQDAETVGEAAVGVQHGVPEQGEMMVGEPLQQRCALGVVFR